MNPEKVFKRYDIRGKYPEELDEEFAEKIGQALGTFLIRRDEQKLVLVRDNKKSSINLKESFISGIKSTGIEVLDAGTGPTDKAAFIGSKKKVFSAQVTSSHLPLEFNGFKFMYPEGNGLLNEDLEIIKDIFRTKDFSEGSGETKNIGDEASERYVRALKSFFNEYFDSVSKKVVLDCMGGSSSLFLPDILESLGIELEKIDNPGPANPPNPKPANLEKLEKKVDNTKAELGIANDMDADRVTVYYKGEWLDGNTLFGILTQIVDANRSVASIDTSRTIEKLTEETFYTRVGDPFVIDKVIEENADIAGEPNGHYCFPDFVAYNSGILAAMLFCGADMDSLMSELPDTYIERSSVETEDKERTLKNVCEEVRERYNVLSEKDGIKFELKDATVLMRTSGSSDLVRIVSESDQKKSSEKALNQSEKLVRNS